MVREVRINEWACDNCHTVFYTYLDEDAVCPECGDPSRLCGEAVFILLDEEFDKTVDHVVQQECGACWVYREETTEDCREEAEEIVNACAIAKMLETIRGDGCPAKD
jgi:RNA polymerase subunit RPABC4/transcription elongation factor Spt4